jgi:hypothetical protein
MLEIYFYLKLTAVHGSKISFSLVLDQSQLEGVEIIGIPPPLFVVPPG